MSAATSCPHCGANLGPADLQRPACPYCGTVHPHVAAAAAKVEVLKQLLAPGPGGVPAVFSGMVGAAPPATGHPMHGGPPMQPMQPMGAPAWTGVVMVSRGGALVPFGNSPPMTGGPVGGGAPYLGGPAQAPRAAQSMALIITVSVVAILLVVGGAVAALFFLAF